jgi:hypothetical protein
MEAERKPLKRFGVFAKRQMKEGLIGWQHVGVAMENRDGSINVHLDSLPLDGTLSLRADP